MDPADRQRLLSLFAAEAEDGLAVMAGLAARFEQRDDQASVTELGETAHSIKGAAAAVGLPELVWAIHRVEALAARVGATPLARRAPDHTRLLRAIDLLATAAGGLGVKGALGPEEPAQLRALLADIEPSTPAPGQAQVPAEEPQASSVVAAPEGGFERLSVPASTVDEALRLASALARQAAALQEQCAESQSSTVARAAAELALTSERLEANLFRLRMIPAAESLAGLDSEVQSLAARLGKDVRAIVEDRGVRADRRTLQAARGMIRHLVRNAVDHGLESSAERLAIGKQAHGTLRISMSMAESRLEVSVADDGRGFDVAAIRRRLVATSDEASVLRLSDDEALAAFAIAGGSTRETVTEISGRGMGLSAVVSLVRARGGDFRVQSERGRGSITHLTVPLEVYSVDVLTLSDDGLTLGVPIAAVEQTLVLGKGTVIQQGPSGPILPIDERLVHLRSLGVVRGRGLPRPEQRFVVVVRAGGREAAFCVDEVGETARVAPQVVPPWVRPDALVTGVSLLPDGRRLQVLNPARLLGLVGELEEAAPAKPLTPALGVPRRLKLLLAEDSLATREVLRVLLERDGFDVRVAGDGEEALLGIAESLPDVVVSDFNMPRCNGASLVRRLRAAAATATLPVVLLTSRDDASSRAEGAAAGADAYLIKSEFNAAALRKTLKQLGVEGV